MFNLKNFLIITNSYLIFTLTDGAIRMIVLLHFFHLGFSPFLLAILFLLYEFMGIITNFFGGWAASFLGIKRMLNVGILLQILGIYLLSFYSPSWDLYLSVIWIMFAQGLCGIAKDITKTSSKSAIKIVSGKGEGVLFKWVSWFTGLKNTTKGLGFFIGGILVETIGFKLSIFTLIIFLTICFILLFFLQKDLGNLKPSKNFKDLFSKSRNINILSIARVFLFGSRDIWFVVGLPVFLYSTGWSFWQVGSFLALWTIGYGIVQSSIPAFIKRSKDGLSLEILSSKFWVILLTLIQLIILIISTVFDFQVIGLDTIIVIGLLIFGVLFAINSALHSYLILAYSNDNNITEDVGFYYSANALGRFFGTLLSGLLFQIFGIAGCIAGSFVFLSFCIVSTLNLSIKNK
tara:strand:- start:1188 stop:2399 length:1212 start_codon:yes stop_codon:yes gene_type:complete